MHEKGSGWLCVAQRANAHSQSLVDTLIGAHASTYQVMEVSNSGCGSYGCPLSSTGLQKSKVASIRTIASHTVVSAKCLPGQMLYVIRVQFEPSLLQKSPREALTDAPTRRQRSQEAPPPNLVVSGGSAQE